MHHRSQRRNQQKLSTVEQIGILCLSTMIPLLQCPTLTNPKRTGWACWACWAAQTSWLVGCSWDREVHNFSSNLIENKFDFPSLFFLHCQEVTKLQRSIGWASHQSRRSKCPPVHSDPISDKLGYHPLLIESVKS